MAQKINGNQLGDTGGAWLNWVPTLINFTGTVNVARYKIVGKTCHFYIKVTQGSSVTGNHQFTLPVPMDANQALTAPVNAVASGYVQDLGVAQFAAQAMVVNSTTLALICLTAGTAYVAPTTTSPTIPMTWVSGQDCFMLQGFYETA